MTITVETLDKLERKITLSLPVPQVRQEVEQRLKKLARTVKMHGFRPGKVPLSVVAQQYGAAVHYEVVNDQIGQAFFAATSEAGLRVAGQPQISDRQGAPTPAEDGDLLFDARFEVFPEVPLPDLSAAQLERVGAQVDDAAIDRTVDILRKQRRSFAQRAAEQCAQDGDRVSVDFEGKIDGEPFAGGKAEDFQYLLGEGQMLAEFEEAVRGMKAGESKTFQLPFPEDYHGKEVAGKTADFLVTLKKVEAAHLPEVNDAFAKQLGLKEATVEGLRADIRKNLEREVRQRLRVRNKNTVMQWLLEHCSFDLPQALVRAEAQALAESAQADLKARGIKSADQAQLPQDLFMPQAQRRVQLGLIAGELVRAHDLQATPEQVREQVREIASSYERPQEVQKWYLNDAQRMADVQALVTENKLTDFVLAQAQTSEKTLAFDELMQQQQPQQA